MHLAHEALGGPLKLPHSCNIFGGWVVSNSICVFFVGETPLLETSKTTKVTFEPNYIFFFKKVVALSVLDDSFDSMKELFLQLGIDENVVNQLQDSIKVAKDLISATTVLVTT